MAKASKQASLAETVHRRNLAIEIPHSLAVRQLADLLQVSAIDVIKQLMRNGIMANINQVIDYEAAAAVAVSLGYEAHPKPQAAKRQLLERLRSISLRMRNSAAYNHDLR